MRTMNICELVATAMLRGACTRACHMVKNVDDARRAVIERDGASVSTFAFTGMVTR